MYSMFKVKRVDYFLTVSMSCLRHLSNQEMNCVNQRLVLRPYERNV